MKFPLPANIASVISDNAVRRARENMRQRGWSSMNGVLPHSEEGVVGIRTTLKYLIYQNQGTRPRVMWELEGKRIPITDASGTHIITAKNVGKPGFVTMPDGTKIWRQQRWRHPGIKPKYFFQESISGAVKESGSIVQGEMMKILTGEK